MPSTMRYCSIHKTCYCRCGCLSTQCMVLFACCLLLCALQAVCDGRDSVVPGGRQNLFILEEIVYRKAIRWLHVRVAGIRHVSGISTSSWRAALANARYMQQGRMPIVQCPKSIQMPLCFFIDLKAPAPPLTLFLSFLFKIRVCGVVCATFIAFDNEIERGTRFCVCKNTAIKSSKKYCHFKVVSGTGKSELRKQFRQRPDPLITRVR